MSRWTLPNGDYCRDVCGYSKNCKRLKENNPCKVSLYYKGLQEYENAEERLRKELQR